MYDVQKLEAEWLSYHRKKYKKLYFILPIMISLLIFGYFFNEIKSFTLSKIKQSSTLVPHKKSIKPMMLNPASTLLSKNNTFNKSITEEKKIQILPNIPISSQNKEKKKILFSITKSSIKDAYKEVENRFYDSQDIHDAIFLAKVYLQEKNYKKSDKWSLLASSIDGSLEEPWLIYAKSNLKQGKKEKALEIVKQYQKKYNSPRMNKMLRNIEEGNF